MVVRKERKKINQPELINQPIVDPQTEAKVEAMELALPGVETVTVETAIVETAIVGIATVVIFAVSLEILLVETPEAIQETNS